MPKELRLILMGTGPFAVPTFRALHAQNRDRIALCITKPTPLSSSKGKPPTNPVLEWSQEFELPLFQPASINSLEAIERLKAENADLFVVCDYGQILSRDSLATSKLGGINLHGSLLPRHRGAAPVQWSILRGDAMTGVSVIHMSPKLDAGPILSSFETPIGPEENAMQLEVRLSLLGVEPTLKAIDQLRNHTTDDDGVELGRVQEIGLATKARRLSKADGELNFQTPVRILDRWIRGLQPWPGAYSDIRFEADKSIRVSILKARPWEGSTATMGNPGDLLWGDRLRAWCERQGLENHEKKNELAVVASDGLLLIDILQPAGKRAMESREFLMGYQRFAGMHFLSGNEENVLRRELLQKA